MKPRVARVLVAPVAFGIALILAPVAAAPANASGQCGRVLVAGSAWLGAAGVDVKKNVRGADGICNGHSVSNPSVQNGGGWDCFELAARLYYVKGWGRISTRGGGADNIPEGSPWLAYHPNGSGLPPIPGDLLVERYSDHGHVTVVDRVAGGKIFAVEQNATDSGRKTYSLRGSAIAGAYNSGYVRGFLHSPANTNHGVSAAARVFAPPTARGVKVAKQRGPRAVRWLRPKSPLPVTGITVQMSKTDPLTLAPGTWQTKRLSGSARSVTIPKRWNSSHVQFRMRATSLVGPGQWATLGV